MLQQEKPDDFVIATGEQHSVREFVEIAARKLGIEICWKGNGVNEVGIIASHSSFLQHPEPGAPSPVPPIGKEIVRIDPRYFRPTEVET